MIVAIRRLVPACCLALFAAAPLTATAEEGYGTISGQIVASGDIPKPELLVTKGDSKIKDPQVCAAEEHVDNSLLIDASSKGIANVVIYLRSVDDIHPKLEEVPKGQEEVVFDQKNCVFMPHILSVRTGQTVVVKSDDPVPHNTHTHPFKNKEENFTIRPGNREGVKIDYDESEFLPVKVNCDLHPHMTAYWVVLDHPYFAVTDKDGKFEIKDLPEGEYDFIVWHERVGYIDRKVEDVQDALNVEIFSDESEDLGKIEVPADIFKK